MIWIIFWNIGRIYINIFLLNMKNMKSNGTLYFSGFFPIIFSWWKIDSFPFIFIYKRFNCCYFSRIFSTWINWEQQVIESIYYVFYWWDLSLFFGFLSNQENLYMIPHDSDLFYDIYSTLNEHNSLTTIHWS